MPKATPPGHRFLRPPELVAALDRFIIGQDAAKKGLALAAYKHFLGLAASEDANEPEFGQQHVLLVGPTGCGKTHLVREFGRVLDVPMATCSATSLVEAGYAGEQVDSTVRKLLAAARGIPERAERGIIFIDEIDKVRRSGGSLRDVSGEGVQNALLKLMDGVDVSVGKGARTVVVNTRGVLFICAGAFASLDTLQEQISPVGSIGFGNGTPSGTSAESVRFELEDFVEFGMIPEFVGRFATVRHLHRLSLPELERVLVEPEGAVLRRAAEFFSRHGARLRVSPGAVRAIARLAAATGTGARGLDNVASDVLEPTVWRFLQSNRRVHRVVITQDTVERGQRAQFHRTGGHQTKWDVDSLARRAFDPPASVRIARVTNTRGWTNDQLWERIGEVVAALQLDEAPESAKLWWSRFESDNKLRPRTVLRLAEELALRGATVSEFFLAFVYSNSVNLRAVLHYFDYRRLKDEEDRAGCGRGSNTVPS